MPSSARASVRRFAVSRVRRSWRHWFFTASPAPAGANRNRRGAGVVALSVAALLLAQGLWSAGARAADELVKNGQYWAVASDGSGVPYSETIGKGRDTLDHQPSILTVNPDATISVTNKNAVSVFNNATIYVGGVVRGNSSTGGLYGTGPNVIEGNSSMTIVVGYDGQNFNTTGVVEQIGNTTNGEAINLHGFGNQIANYGTIRSTQNSAAIWFQDVVSSGGDPNQRNVVTNYGSIIQSRGGNVMGTSAGNGIIFYNKDGGLVSGNLSFAQGNDDLYFEAGSQVKGNINGGGGTNSLYLEGSDPAKTGYLNGAVTNFQTLTKIGKGVWEITGSLQGFKTTTVEDGTLRITGNNANYTGTLLINRNDQIGHLGIVEARPQSLPTNNPATGYTNNIYNNGILRFIEDQSGSYNGQIVGTGVLEMTGSGVVLLTPNAAAGNTYSGGTYIKNGTLAIAKTSALGTGDLYLGSGAPTNATAGTLRLDGDGITLAKDVILQNGGGVIDTNGHDGTVSGTIMGGGTFAKAGDGTLRLTGVNAWAGGLYIDGGTLEVGDGGTSGQIPYRGIMNIRGAGAALAINHSDAVTVETNIIGAGKLIQRGTGSLTLNRASTYTGGTEIEAGSINIMNAASLGSTTGAGADAGHVAYTGGTAAKAIYVMPGVAGPLRNHFHTDTGTQNTLQTSGDTEISGVSINRGAEDAGGAFYIGSGTALTVNLFGNTTLQNNTANGNPNDIYIADSATMDLAVNAEKTAYIRSGLAGGNGTLNVNNLGTVQVEANSPFKGTTNVSRGTLRVVSGVTYGDAAGAFNVTGGSTAFGTAAGGGTIRANTVNVTGVLSPDSITTGGTSQYGTLTFQASGTKIFSGFRLDMDFDGPTTIGGAANPHQQDLLVINGGTAGTSTAGFGGTVNFQTGRDGDGALTKGEYRVIVSDTGFDLGGKALDGVGNTTGAMRASVNGQELTNNGNTPRGTIGFDYRNNNKEIWLIADIDSLTMDWTGIGGAPGAPKNGDWVGYQERFRSQQVNGTLRETNFMDGDKVHLATDDANGITVALTDSRTGSAVFPTVSGLVVGRDSGGVDHNGNVTIAGLGGIGANINSAFGVYATGSATPALVATGKLEKRGTGTLTFTNTGGNLFGEGVDLYAGTTAINRADQLSVNSGKAITFVGNATLQANASMSLETPVFINSNQNAYLNVVGADTGLFMKGNLGGGAGSLLIKNGLGVLQFSETVAGANLVHNTYVTAGKFRIVQDKTYNSTGSFGLTRTAELSGGGTVAANHFNIDGKIATDKAVMTPDSMVVTGDKRFGTLTLKGTTPAASTANFTSTVAGTERQGFNFDYRVLAPNTLGGDPLASGNDLLAIRDVSGVNLQGGVINVMTDGASLANGSYLVIDSNVEIKNGDGVSFSDPGSIKIDGISNRIPGSEGAVWGKINGNDIIADGPRGYFEFTLENGLATASQLWLTVESNSLQSVWKGGNGLWSTGGWLSKQFTPGDNHDRNFFDGDLAYFDNTGAAGNYTVTVDRDVTASGVDVNTTRTITFDGDGGILARKKTGPADTVIVGVYADGAGAQSQRFDTTGTLEKRGSGTLVLANKGENFFEQGTEIAAGTVRLEGTDGKRLGTYNKVLNSNKDGLVTFKNTAGGGDDTTAKRVVFAAAAPAATRAAAPAVQNRFVVEQGVKNAALTAAADTVVSGVGHDDQNGGAVYVDRDAQLAINATGGDFTFEDNNLVMASGMTKANDILIETGGKTVFNLASNHNVLINSGIAGSGNVDIQGTSGRVQVASFSDNNDLQGRTTVKSAGLRVVDDQTYGGNANTGFQLGTGTAPGQDKAWLEGDGTVRSNNLIIGGYVSPDGNDLRYPTATDKKADTLTLRGTNAATSTATFVSAVDTTPGANDRTGFHFDYDAVDPNSTASEKTGVTNAEKSPTATDNDLLAVRSVNEVRLQGGVVNVKTGADGLKTGRYLIMDSDKTITDAAGNRFVENPAAGRTVLDGINDYTANQGVLWGKLNGQDMRSKTPRGEREFYLDSRDGMPEDSQIWLAASRNTLKTVWQVGNGVWTDSGAWKSEQYSEVDGTLYHDKAFNNGDYVVFNGGTYAVNLADHVVVSGMDAATADGVVTINGAGGIRGIRENAAGTSYIEGMFAKTDGSADPADQEFNTTGKLVKTGAGELAFRNTGGNFFEEGIELFAGVTSFDLANQLGNVPDAGGLSSGDDILFAGNATLRAVASVATANQTTIASGKTATFEVLKDAASKDEVEWKFSGDLLGGADTKLRKTGAGKLSLYDHYAEVPGEPDPAPVPSTFAGTVEAAAGELAVYGDYGSTRAYSVADGAVLSGTGVLGGASGGRILKGGTLAPGGLSVFRNQDTAPVMNPLTILGNLSFDAGSVFAVRIAQFDEGGEKYTPYSDQVVVKNGTVDIDAGAKLNVDIDFWGDTQTIQDFNADQSGHFTIIDASDKTAYDPGQVFGELTLSRHLPRGIVMKQGWFDDDPLYQLWFEVDPDGGFNNLCDRWNRVEIGTVIDGFVVERNGALHDLIDLLSDPSFSDKDVCLMLDWLTGDIVPNLLTPKKPWRQTFGMLDSGFCVDVFCPHEEEGLERPVFWAEGFRSFGDAHSDHNAHPFTLNRSGVDIGYNHWLSDRSVVGFVLQFSEATLRQRTGRGEIDDYGAGLYGRFELGYGFDAKAYAGYSRQRYDITRTVSLPASATLAGINDRFSDDVWGYDLAGSLDVGRAFDLGCWWRVRPSAALEYERVVMDGYREKGGITALKYSDSRYNNLGFRLGAESSVRLPWNLRLQTDLYWEHQLNNRDYAETRVRFANAQTAANTHARIRGIAFGRNALNAGAGLEWRPEFLKGLTVSTRYDASVYENLIVQAGHFGLSWEW